MSRGRYDVPALGMPAVAEPALLDTPGNRALAEYLESLERPHWAGADFDPIPCPRGGNCQWAIDPATGRAYCVKCKKVFGARGEAA